MTNQAAQTMPELPVALASIHADGYWTTDDRRPDWKWPARQRVFSVDQMHQYARDYAAALSQTAGVADIDAFMAKWEWLILSRCRDEFRADLAAMLAAAPAASGVDTSTNEAWAARAQEKIAAMEAATGGEDDMCPNCVTPWKCNGSHESTGGASVSERARELLAQQYMDSKFAHLNAIGLCIRDGSLENDTAISLALRAIEQALTQQRSRPELPPWRQTPMSDLISNLQSMRDRMMDVLPNRYGDQFDGDFDVMLEAINALKRSRDSDKRAEAITGAGDG